MVAPLRLRPVAEAYLRLHTLAGEQAQVDWAHMGHVVAGKAKRPLMAFVMVLSYSRRIFPSNLCWNDGSPKRGPVAIGTNAQRHLAVKSLFSQY